MALKKVRGNIERMFDKNLTDLVRGIRNSKENEASAGGTVAEFRGGKNSVAYTFASTRP